MDASQFWDAMNNSNSKNPESLPSPSEVWYADNDVRYVSTPPSARTFCGVAHESRYAWVLRNQELEGKTVLDFGSGSGHGTHLLGSRAALVHGIDYPAQAVAYAATQYAKENVAFFRADASSAQEILDVLQPDTYDLITSFDVIEHISAYRGYLANVVRLLKTDGALLIGCPNRLQTLNWNRTWNPFHKQEFGPRQFREILQDYFEDVTLVSQDFFDPAKREAARVRNYEASKPSPPLLLDDADIAFVEEPDPAALDQAFGLMAICKRPRRRHTAKDPVKVLLIEPKYASKEALPWIPIGKGYLAALLRREGFEVKIIDNALHALSDAALLQQIESYRPTIVGTGGMTLQMSDTLRIVRLIRSSSVRDALLIGGGVHFTLLPDDGIDLFDLLVMGEGESTFLDICNRFRGRGGSREAQVYADIPGLCCKVGDTMVRSESRPFIEDLDALPLPAYDLLDVKQYNDFLITGERAVSVMTGRGCPFDCQFCAAPTLSRRKVRTFSLQYTFRLMEYLQEVYGFTNFRVMDDTFASCKQRVVAFCDEIRKRKMKLNLTCLTHVNTADEATFRAMREAGFTIVALGIESGNDEILKKINKRITRRRAIRAINLAKQAGLLVEGLFMIGNVGETKETIEDTIKFASTYNPVFVNGKRAGFNWFQFATPFPGSRFHKSASRYGTVVSTNYDDYTHQTPVFIPTGLDVATMVQLRQRALQEAGYGTPTGEHQARLVAEQRYREIHASVAADRMNEVYRDLVALADEFPTFAHAHNDLGVLAYACGNKDTALKHCRLAVELAPGNVNFLKNLADVLYLSFGRIVEAVSIYLDLASRAPDDIEVLLALGNASVALGEIADAEKFFDRVHRLDPSNNLAQQGLAFVRAQHNQASLVRTTDVSPAREADPGGTPSTV